MQRSGIADLPLHGGKAPRWLFKRMVHLAKGIFDILSIEFGPEELIRRLSDPFWFQAFSCVLGYDWHSSGTTTVTCGALKEAIQPEKHGIVIAGGKGKVARKTLQEIHQYASVFHFSESTIKQLQYASKMAAKIDTAVVQDGYDLYHHVFFFSDNELWGVIQQGMNNHTNNARRYHWISENVKSFVCEPHNSILGTSRHSHILNMTAIESVKTQEICVDLVNDHPNHLKQTWTQINLSPMQTTIDGSLISYCSSNIPMFELPRHVNWNLLKEVYEFQPKDYEEFVSIPGVGHNTIRALAFISDLVYGSKPSWNDPVKYSFTVGGKDGVPFPVDTRAMDESINLIESAVQQARIDSKERLLAIKRLKRFVQPVHQ